MDFHINLLSSMCVCFYAEEDLHARVCFCSHILFTYISERLNQLTGVVNESLPSHLGILVFSLFNASVSADHLHRAGYSFDLDSRKWTKEDGDEEFGIDSLIKFRIERIHEVGGEISMEGMEPVLVP